MQVRLSGDASSTANVLSTCIANGYWIIMVLRVDFVFGMGFGYLWYNSCLMCLQYNRRKKNTVLSYVLNTTINASISQ